MILGVIPARGGSKGVPMKNIRAVRGKPLLAYAIECGRNSGVLDRVVVSTDSDEIAAVAKSWGGEVPFMRPAELARDTTPTLPVLEHALLECEKLYGEKVECVVLIDPTAPLRSSEDIQGALSLFREGEVDVVVSASPAKRNPYFNMVQIGPEGYAELPAHCGRPVNRRQDAPQVYDLNTVCWVFSRDAVLVLKERLPARTKAYIVPEDRSIDLDTLADFESLEIALERQGRKV